MYMQVYFDEAIFLLNMEKYLLVLSLYFKIIIALQSLQVGAI